MAGAPSAGVTFTYAAPPVTPPPTITKLIPTSGPDTGGTLVDIIGTDLTGATAVDFGGTAGTGLTVDPSGNLATVTSPAHTAGPAPVTITTPAGTSATLRRSRSRRRYRPAAPSSLRSSPAQRSPVPPSRSSAPT
jgi:hypothetical protein